MGLFLHPIIHSCRFYTLPLLLLERRHSALAHLAIKVEYYTNFWQELIAFTIS